MNIKQHIVCPHCHETNRIPKKDSYNKANCGHCKQSLLDTSPINLDRNNFDNHLVNSDIPVVVDFWEEWCGPCKMMAPSHKQSAQEFALKVRFAKVNTENNAHIGARFSVKSLPTMIIFKNGLEVGRQSGALSSKEISKWVAQYV